MPRLEIETKLGSYIAEKEHYGQARTEKVLLAELPDEDGTYQTATGEVAIAILIKNRYGKPKEIAVEAESLKGKPSRHKSRRSGEKHVSLGEGGCGQQTISKKEVLSVTLLDSYAYRNTYGMDAQLNLPLGLPVKGK
jgi:hypothetical protein